MKQKRVGRRRFIEGIARSAAVMSALPKDVFRMSTTSGHVSHETSGQAAPPVTGAKPKIRFGVIGVNHSHINSMVDAVLRGGGELVSMYAQEPDLATAFVKRYPQAKRAGGENEILEDSSIQLVLSAAIPDERAPHRNPRHAARQGLHGGQAWASPRSSSSQKCAACKRPTKRIYSIMYSERLENRATVKAGDLVKAGAIGRVVQTIGLGPHRMTPKTRPAWFFERPRYGGILCDIGSHQADQFLFFTGSTRADVVSSQVGERAQPAVSDLRGFWRRYAARR